MNESWLTRDVTIVNPRGFHARPAHVFVSLANQFQATIEIRKGGERVDGKSILSILTLGAENGTPLTLYARGADAQRALDSLGALIDQGFDPDELEEDEDEEEEDDEQFDLEAWEEVDGHNRSSASPDSNCES